MSRQPRAAEALRHAVGTDPESVDLETLWDDGSPVVSFEPKTTILRRRRRRHDTFTNRSLGNGSRTRPDRGS